MGGLLNFIFLSNNLTILHGKKLAVELNVGVECNPFVLASQRLLPNACNILMLWQMCLSEALLQINFLI